MLNDISFYQMQSQFETIIESGNASILMAKLVYEVVDEDEDIEVILRDIAEEQGIEYPTHENALINLAVFYAHKIVDGEIKPKVGADFIFNKIICECNRSLADKIGPFEALSSEYDDFSDDEHQDFYGESKCTQELERINSDIIDASKALLKNYG